MADYKTASSSQNNMNHTVYPLFSVVPPHETDTTYAQSPLRDVNSAVLIGKLAAETVETLLQFSPSQKLPLTISLSLPVETGSEQCVELMTTLTEVYGESGVNWIGQSRLLPDLQGFLSIIPDPHQEGNYWVSGRINSHNGRCWLINSHSGSHINLIEATVPPMSCFARVPVRLQLPEDLKGNPSPENADTFFAGEPQDTAVIQIMAACPASTLQKLNMGAPAVRAKIADWQNVVNTIMRNSGVNARIEIQDELFTLPEPENNMVRELLHETLANSGNPSLNKRGPDSLWAVVQKLRDQTKSDLVLLLAADLTGDVLGEAGSIPLPPRIDFAGDLAQCTLCFCPEARGYDVGHIFAHELGHLLGGLHDPETDMSDSHHLDSPPMFDYVCGYQPADGSFMTTMAYPREGKPWILYYSAASQQWLNPQTGKREAVGIPFGQPNAADAASFFKTSTRTVARYRGGAQVRFCDLKFSVSPPLGGALIPESWGPYPESSQVTVKAIARPGYTFDHWQLDDQIDGSQQPLSVTVNASRKVTAHFREGLTRYHLNTDVVADANLKAKLTIYSTDRDPAIDKRQSGPDYHPGTDVYIDCDISHADSEKYAFSGWRVNGNKHLVQGHQFENHDKSYLYRLIVRMEEDVRAEAMFTHR